MAIIPTSTGLTGTLTLVLLLCCTIAHGGLFDNVTFVNGTGCMFFFSRLNLVHMKTNELVTLPTNPKSSSVDCQTDKSTLRLTYNAVGEIQSMELSLVLSEVARSWQATTANISITCAANSKTCVPVKNGQLRTDWLTAPSNMSYKCQNTPVTAIVSSDEKSAVWGVHFYWLQFQPFGAVGGRFNQAVDCTGLFTIPIWSALLVSFLLIGILSYGLVMLSAVQPNMLYDDPKTKMVQLGGNN